MKGTRFKPILRECLGTLSRELKIAFTPVPVDKKWVFLVGCYNSGTTLLAELLAQHPSISALPTEGHFITDQFVTDYGLGLPRMWVNREDIFCLTEEDEGPDSYRIKKEWAMRLDTSKPILLEKSPPNSARTRWLQKHFDNAYFIAIVRNGYAVAEGISRKAEPGHLIDGWPIEMSAFQWKRSNDVLKNDSEYLKRFMWVKYEDLAANTFGTLDSIAEFIGISNFEGFEHGRTWKIHERDEPIKDMNQVSINRLNRNQIDKINKIAGDAIEEFGYTRL